MLIFDGREVVEVANKQPPSGTGMCMSVFDGGGGGGGKQVATIERKHMRRGDRSGKPAATVRNKHAHAHF